MAFVKKLLVKFAGKRINKALDKYGISKAKVAAIVGALIIGYNSAAPEFGLPLVEEKWLEFLAAFGLWALRDGIESKEA